MTHSNFVGTRFEKITYNVTEEMFYAIKPITNV